MKLLSKLMVVLLVVLAPAAVFAEGDFAGEAMSIGVGARPLGMGGTFAAIANDASTSYWNPAGMANVQGVEVSSVKLTKINDLDTKYSYVNLLYNVSPQVGAFGLGWLRQAIGGIQLSAVDNLGNPIQIEGLKENADNTVYLAYARSIVPGFSAGTTVKILLGNYPAVVSDGTISGTSETEVSYSGFGIDLGLHLKMGDLVKDLNGLSIGVNFQDVYTTLSWQANGVSSGATETVPVNIKPGIAYDLKLGQFNVIASADLDTKYQLIIHAGGELWWNNMIAVRGGIKNYSEISSGLAQAADWSIGASIRWYFIGLDYAYVYNELTPVQYLSIIGKF
ncbi:MAG: PorV/PorQ family protein [Candidatus Goldbacteria bacterium]|nr:PorV/PorQ family protein [Candidatus Goldiibacteriota bacterium]